MDKEGFSSNPEITSETTPVRQPQNNTGHKKARAKSDTGPKKKKMGSKKPLDPGITQIAIAIIGLIGTITVAWFTYKASLPSPTPPPVFTTTPMPSPIPSFTELPATFTEIPSATFTAIPLPTNTDTDTSTPVPSETLTLLPQPKLIVLLQANKTSGKSPLNVKLDARETYLTDYDGQRYVCKFGPCHYSWKVYINGQQIGKAVTGSGGTFDYKFGKKGIYTVTVWVCRGQDERDCGGSGTQIVVT